MHGFPMFVASTSLLSPLDIWTRIITIFQITRHLKMFMTVLAKATEFWSFLGQQLLNYPSSTVLGYLVIFCNFRPRPMISTLWSGVRMRLEISWLPLAWFRKWIPHKTDSRNFAMPHITSGDPNKKRDHISSSKLWGPNPVHFNRLSKTGIP